MKYKNSLYNTFIPFGSNFILFNTLSKELLLLTDELKNIYNAAIIHEEIDDFISWHSDMGRYLIQHGFLIDEKVNEYEKAKTYIKSYHNQSSGYKLIVNPTMNCNFKCWYCYESHVKNSKMNTNVIDKISLLVENILKEQNLKYFELSFFGGEPFLYYRQVIKPLLEIVKEKCIRYNVNLIIGFTTNGYLLNENIINEILLFSRDVHFQITLDGDELEHNKVRFVSKNKGSFKEIIENIKMISFDCTVTLRINYTKSNFHSIKNIFYEFKNEYSYNPENIEISLSRVWQENFEVDKDEYQNIIKVIKSINLKLPASISVDSVKNPCYADTKNQVTVNYNGDVYKCTARDFNKENKEGYIRDDGHIIWNERGETRKESRFNNKPCKTCFLFPMCSGGCSQYSLENSLSKSEYCVFDFDEKKKKDFILEYLQDYL